MRKLLISLCAASCFSLAYANYLPNDNYEGFLQSAKGTIDHADASKTQIENDNIVVSLPTLQDIKATDGSLSGQVVNMGQGATTDCVANASFSAKKFGIPVSASNVHIFNCSFDDASGTFSGKYSADVPLFGTQTGTFQFQRLHH